MQYVVLNIAIDDFYVVQFMVKLIKSIKYLILTKRSKGVQGWVQK